MTWYPPGPALLFVPADRPDRYAKATARADVAILDLEDAVAPSAKESARRAVAESSLDPDHIIVRLNPAGSEWFPEDLAALKATPYRVAMLPKTESPGDVAAVPMAVIALLETPRGILHAEAIAAAPNCIGLMWGAEDLVAAMGGSTSRFTSAEVGRTPGTYRDVPRQARAHVALAAAASGRFAIDAVHLDFTDEDGLQAEALDAVALGYAGTACIHPRQVSIVRAAYAPTAEQIAWAERLLTAAEDQPGVFTFENRMIDGPLLTQARAILRRR